MLGCRSRALGLVGFLGLLADRARAAASGRAWSQATLALPAFALQRLPAVRPARPSSTRSASGASRRMRSRARSWPWRLLRLRVENPKVTLGWRDGSRRSTPDVILRDGRTCACGRRGAGTTRTRCWRSSVLCRSGASTCVLPRPAASSAPRLAEVGGRGGLARAWSAPGRRWWTGTGRRVAAVASHDPPARPEARRGRVRGRRRASGPRRRHALARAARAARRRGRASSGSSPRCSAGTIRAAARRLRSRRASRLTRELRRREVEVQFPIAATRAATASTSRRATTSAVVASLGAVLPAGERRQ